MLQKPVSQKQDPVDKHRLLVAEALRWVGTREHGGPNHGEIVALFQGWNKRPNPLPWCMAFVQYCLARVDWTHDRIADRSCLNKHAVFPTNHVLSAWKHTPAQYRRSLPKPGYLSVWQRYNEHGPTQFGHAGIIVQTQNNPNHFVTVEGNTSLPCADGSTRGVWRKNRSLPGMGRFRLIGFLDPWPDTQTHKQGEI